MSSPSSGPTSDSKSITANVWEVTPGIQSFVVFLAMSDDMMKSIDASHASPPGNKKQMRFVDSMIRTVVSQHARHEAVVSHSLL